MSQVSAQSPVIDFKPQTLDEEKLRDQVILLQKQVAGLEQQITAILNKPKRGVRVQVNSGPIMSNKTTQTESSGSPPDSFKSNFSGSSGRSTIGHTTPVNIGKTSQ